MNCLTRLRPLSGDWQRRSTQQLHGIGRQRRVGDALERQNYLLHFEAYIQFLNITQPFGTEEQVYGKRLVGLNKVPFRAGRRVWTPCGRVP
jgi:hypothetical protein